MYYLLSGYICVLYCEYIYNYIYIYIYLLIYFIYLYLFILFIHMLYCIVFYLFITYIIIYIYRERDHITLQRSNPTSSCLAASGCGVILGPPKPPLGDSASAEWDSAAGPPNGNCPSKGWCRIKNDGISMEYIYIHLSIHPSIYVCMHACMYIYVCVYILILI